MKKRKLCSIILLIIILLTSCAGAESMIGEMKILTPNSENKITDPFIVENLDYRKHMHIDSIDEKRYKVSQFSKIYNSTKIEALINGEIDGYSVYIVKKVGIKSYFFETKHINDAKCYFSVAELEVKAVVHSGEEKRGIGSSIFVTENYGIDSRGTFVTKNASMLYYYSGDHEINIRKGDFLKNDTYYLLILSNDDKVNFTKSDEVYCNSWEYVFPEAFNEFPYLDYDMYDYVELSEDTYNRALDVKAERYGYTDSMIGCSQMVLYAYDNYGNILPEVNHNSPIGIGVYITTTICIIEGLALIIIAFIKLKRSKSTPSGTPQTVEHIKPEASDTPNTPDTPEARSETASPPDVTEPLGPPKEE